MTTEQTTKCAEYHLGDSAFTTHPCKWPAKGQDEKGRWLCGRHLAGAKRRAALAVDILKELDTQAGVHYEPSFGSGMGHYTGNIVIDPADLFRLLGMGVRLPDKQQYREAE